MGRNKKKQTRENNKKVSAEAENDNIVLFYHSPSVFSQWHMTEFAIDQSVYCCTEQYMMAEKARLFNDQESLNQIMATRDPSSMKRLGRFVSGFDQEIWERDRYDIVKRGNLAKFSQNEELKQRLLATGDKIIVEASPTDRIWGIGLAIDDPYAFQPSRWRGQNLLGKALMDVRQELVGAMNESKEEQQ